MNRRLFLGSCSVLAGCATRREQVHSAPPPASGEHDDSLDRQLAELESNIGGRVGVWAFAPHTQRTLARRADERFAMCSTFKWALAAAVLKRVDSGEWTLEQRLRFSSKDLQDYAPVTKLHVDEGSMNVTDLVTAVVTLSDNTAANLLLDQLGGPKTVTTFLRGLGDQVTRLDRLEPMLNTNEAGDPRDTTSPRAMATSLWRVLTSDVLSTTSRDRLAQLLIETKTGLARLRAGLPSSYLVGDKTGSGNRGACNDVAVVWPRPDEPWFVASYLSGSSAPLAELDAAHARVGTLVAELIGD
jgi:beta-lactamase class A